MQHRERIAGWLIGLILLAIVAAAIYLVVTQFTDKSRIRIGDAVLSATVADTDEKREKGLSGRQSLGANEAMLFVYDIEETWGIWMKDMNFPIDIVWLNDKKEVVYIVKNAQPESYPDTTFLPRAPARYVLEVPAGTVERKNIRIGSAAIFDIE